jgi:hypothetical protein
MRSMPAIQRGSHLGPVLVGRPRRRSATTTSTTPASSLTAKAAVDGADWGMRGSPPVTSAVSATMPTSVSSQPRRKPRPLRSPPSAANNRIMADSGIGSTVTTKPIKKRSSSMRAPAIGQVRRR